VYKCLTFLLSDDYNRVVLEASDDSPDSDYINASYVDVSHLLLIILGWKEDIDKNSQWQIAVSL